MNPKIYVAMSGGVDSSVTAALLQEQGYSVVGVFMKFWSPDQGGACIWKQEREDALKVAVKLGIPLLTWDFTKEYGEKVVAYMLEAYEAGITPNPDIMCNKEIKFGMFFDRAMEEGADYVATGHYARIAHEIPNDKFQITNKNQKYQFPIPNDHTTPTPLLSKAGKGGDNNSAIQQFNNHHLLKAKDLNKDQSYFLYTLERRHLAKTLFPIGGLTKPEVRELAKKFGLPTAAKKDSQGVCFIGPLKMKSFLNERIKPAKGDVYHVDGRHLGTHDGAWYYTIGQRHGLDLKKDGGPYYVVRKDVKNNILYLGDEEDLLVKTAEVSNVHWIGEIPGLPANIGVKIRYRAETIEAALSQFPNNPQIPIPKYQILFEKPVRAIASGQAAVFYCGEKVLGGGTFV